jgi:putative phosphoesterase
MILGLLSDTHDRIEPLELALKLLGDAGAEFYIHCGDVGGEEILDALAGLQCAFVWGNNDWDRDSLGRYAHDLHLQVCNTFGQIPVDGKMIAITHGDDMSIIQRVMREEKFDYLFTGHTHIPHDHRYGKLRWINPGALHRARPKTCATLDLQSDKLTLLELPPG